jgi:hypothetical protein
MSQNPLTGIQITRPQDWNFRPAESWGVRAAAPAGAAEKSWSNDVAGMPRTMLIRGSNPYVDLLEEPAHHYSSVHHHTEPEVMVVLQGRMMLNGEWCETGSVIFVPANEEYWHATTDSACLVAVIRPTERGLLMHGADTRARMARQDGEPSSP